MTPSNPSLSPTRPTPTFLLWAHQLKRENNHILSRLATLEASSAREDLLSEELQQRLLNLEKGQRLSSKENATSHAQLLARVHKFEKRGQVSKEGEAVKGLDEKLARIEEGNKEAGGVVSSMGKMVITLTSAHTDHVFNMNELAKRVELLGPVCEGLETNLWKVEDLLKNADVERKIDEKLFREVMGQVKDHAVTLLKVDVGLKGLEQKLARVQEMLRHDEQSKAKASRVNTQPSTSFFGVELTKSYSQYTQPRRPIDRFSEKTLRTDQSHYHTQRVQPQPPVIRTFDQATTQEDNESHIVTTTPQASLEPNRVEAQLNPSNAIEAQASRQTSDSETEDDRNSDSATIVQQNFRQLPPPVWTTPRVTRNRAKVKGIVPRAWTKTLNTDAPLGTPGCMRKMQLTGAEKMSLKDVISKTSRALERDTGVLVSGVKLTKPDETAAKKDTPLRSTKRRRIDMDYIPPELLAPQQNAHTFGGINVDVQEKSQGERSVRRGQVKRRTIDMDAVL